MDWDDVRTFLAIARARSLSGAARALGVRQSTMSRRLEALELRAGARLRPACPPPCPLNRSAAACLHVPSAACGCPSTPAAPLAFPPAENATSGSSISDLLANRSNTRIVFQAAVAAGLAETLSGAPLPTRMGGSAERFARASKECLRCMTVYPRGN